MTLPVTSKSEGSRLSVAAKAAALAGSAAALAAPNAQAVPIPASNVPISISFNNPGPFEWDVDNNGQFEFRLFVEGDYAIHLASYPDGNGRGMVNLSSTGDNVHNLPKGFLVGPALASGYFGNGSSTYRQMIYRSKYTYDGIPYTYSGIGYDANGFTDGVPGCIGFRFTDGVNMFYGWAKIQIDLGADPTLTILESYYNDEPDAAIGCCETTTPVPESASTASLLALGAAGLALYRRRMAARSAA